MDEAVLIMKQLSEGKSWSGEFMCKGKDGRSFPVFVTNSPVLDDNGKMIGIIGVSNDISQQKELENKLRESEKQVLEKMEEYTAANEELIQTNEELSSLMTELNESNKRITTIFKAIPDIMFTFSEKGDFLDYHTSNIDLLWNNPKDFLNKNINDVLPEELAILTQNTIHKVLKTDQLHTFSFPYERNNKIEWNEARLLKLSNEKVLCII